jgi:hypothetical protein
MRDPAFVAGKVIVDLGAGAEPGWSMSRIHRWARYTTMTTNQPSSKTGWRSSREF